MFFLATHKSTHVCCVCLTAHYRRNYLKNNKIRTTKIMDFDLNEYEDGTVVLLHII